MTDTELSAIRARCEAATPGPWEDGCDEKFHVAVQGTEKKIATMRVRFDREQNCYNAIFIAHARTDIPALLAHIEELKTALGNEEAESFALGIEIMLGKQVWTADLAVLILVSVSGMGQLLGQQCCPKSCPKKLAAVNGIHRQTTARNTRYFPDKTRCRQALISTWRHLKNIQMAERVGLQALY